MVYQYPVVAAWVIVCNMIKDELDAEDLFARGPYLAPKPMAIATTAKSAKTMNATLFDKRWVWKIEEVLFSAGSSST